MPRYSLIYLSLLGTTISGLMLSSSIMAPPLYFFGEVLIGVAFFEREDEEGGRPRLSRKGG